MNPGLGGVIQAIIQIGGQPGGRLVRPVGEFPISLLPIRGKRGGKATMGVVRGRAVTVAEKPFKQPMKRGG